MTSPEGVRGAPTRARLAVGVVSAGRVGTALGEALDRAGHPVTAVAAVSDAARARAAERLPEAAVLPADEVAARADLLVLAVPDDALPGLVRGLAVAGALRPGQIVAHTAGALGVRVLAPAAAAGALPLALHPAMTFTGRAEDTERLATCCFGVTAADEAGWTVAESLVVEVGAEPVRVAEEQRTLYPAALAHGANHLVTLVRDATAALAAATTAAGVATPAERVLAPLLSAALDSALRLGDRGLTGPVARGDATTVARHLDVLTDLDPALAAGYRALSRRTAERAGAAGLVDPAAAAAVLEVLA